MIDLNKVVVRKGGLVDTRASLAAFKTELDYLTQQEKSEAVIFEDAAHAVFDSQPGTSIPMPALIAHIVNAMAATPDNWSELAGRARNYLHTNAEGDRSVFIITKGKGGGVRRRSDIPIEQN